MLYEIVVLGPQFKNLIFKDDFSRNASYVFKLCTVTKKIEI